MCQRGSLWVGDIGAETQKEGKEPPGRRESGAKALWWEKAWPVQGSRGANRVGGGWLGDAGPGQWDGFIPRVAGEEHTLQLPQGQRPGRGWEATGTSQPPLLPRPPMACPSASFLPPPHHLALPALKGVRLAPADLTSSPPGTQQC